MHQLPGECKHTLCIIIFSAGVGRTGVLLSMIIAMERAWRDGHVDFVETVNTLRKQRMNMIQNEVEK